jgi:SAM-dependent MidA family methyltransferase
VPSAADAVARAIAEAGGAIPFERFMALALYGEGGFYTSGSGRAGRRGDFLTSPEVGPLFGAVLARALDEWWDELGRPDPYTVVDAGAGPGTLARSVLAAGPRCSGALRYAAVEVAEAQRAMHPPGVETRPDLPPGPFDGVILANELLDNLPAALLVHDSGWREAYVVQRSDGRLAEVLGPALDPGALAGVVLPDRPPHGARLALERAAATWTRDALSRLGRGRLVVIDYAVAATAEMVRRPWREWLRTYRGHDRGGHYLDDPGDQDLTVEVALDQLVAAVGEPDWVRTQAQLLARFGIDELVEEGRRHWEQAAARPDLEAMRMRSRVREAEALCDPAGLGGFTAVSWVKV